VSAPQAEPLYESGEGALLLADISGYTSFLQAVATAHAHDAFAGGNIPEAYRLMSSLLDGIVGSVVPPFTLSKLEGDAVFAYGRLGPDIPRGTAMLDCIRRCHADFRDRLADVGQVWTCSCEACLRAATLDLKFVLHTGGYVAQRIAGSHEVSGPSVVMAHRLLKNRAATVIGTGAYALLTDAAVSALDVPVESAVPMTEEVEHYAPIRTFVFALT